MLNNKAMPSNKVTIPFGILILAAGQSSRFGSDKLMAPLGNNNPMISHSLKPLLSLSKDHDIELCVITRPDNLQVINYLKHEGINYSLCPDADSGMGHSIAYGVKSTQLWQGWLIALADMPNIHLELLVALLEEIKTNPDEIIRPAFTLKGKVRPAHPVYFPKKYGYLLSKLTGDQGAKTLIKQQRLITEVNGKLIEERNLIDMDTPESISRLI